MLLAGWQGICQADMVAEKIGCHMSVTETEKALYHDTCKFMRRTSLFPKMEA